jgi:hypothetical protein
VLRKQNENLFLFSQQTGRSLFRLGQTCQARKNCKSASAFVTLCACPFWKEREMLWVTVRCLCSAPSFDFVLLIWVFVFESLVYKKGIELEFW